MIELTAVRIHTFSEDRFVLRSPEPQVQDRRQARVLDPEEGPSAEVMSCCTRASTVVNIAEEVASCCTKAAAGTGARAA